MDSRDEVKHLMVHEVEAVEHSLHAFDLLEFMHILLVGAPRLGKLMLDSFQSPQEVENFLVGFHDILSENSTQRRQITHSIIQREDLPSLITRAALQQLNSEPLLELRVMVLSIRLPDGTIQMSL